MIDHCLESIQTLLFLVSFTIQVRYLPLKINIPQQNDSQSRNHFYDSPIGNIDNPIGFSGNPIRIIFLIG